MLFHVEVDPIGWGQLVMKGEAEKPMVILAWPPEVRHEPLQEMADEMNRRIDTWYANKLGKENNTTIPYDMYIKRFSTSKETTGEAKE